MKYNQIKIKEPVDPDVERLCRVETEGGGITVEGKEGKIEARQGGMLHDMAIYLDKSFDWALELDDDGCLVLVPLKRS